MPAAPVPDIVELAQCEIAPDRSQRYRGKCGRHRLSRTWRFVHRPRFRQSCHSCRASGWRRRSGCRADAVGPSVRSGARVDQTAGRCLFLLLVGFFVLRASVGPDATKAILAGTLGISALAVQNALVQISPKGAPSTAAMRTNVTHFMIDVGGPDAGRRPADVAKARDRAKRTRPAIVGFAVGCGLGATLEAAIGLRSQALPAGRALRAVAMAMTEGGHDP
jgi:hypothetical protein